MDGNGAELAGHHPGGNVRLDCAEKLTPGGKKVVWVRKERKRKMASNNSKYTSEYRQVIFQLIISSGSIDLTVNYNVIMIPKEAMT